MIFHTEINAITYRIDTSKGTDLSIAIKTSNGVNAYYLADAQMAPFRMGSFVGSVKEGGPVNCFDISLNPHGNGTHTECMGHISEEMNSVNQAVTEYFSLAQVITIEPEKIDDDLVLGLNQFHNQIDPECRSLIIRTLPNNTSKLSKRYSGTNPIYLDAGAAEYIRECGIEHLLIDLPSIDKEEDGGALLAHRAFWDFPSAPRKNASITELIFVPNEIKDGIFLLNLQIAPIELDASPSRPVIYPLEIIE